MTMKVWKSASRRPWVLPIDTEKVGPGCQQQKQAQCTLYYISHYIPINCPRWTTFKNIASHFIAPVASSKSRLCTLPCSTTSNGTSLHCSQLHYKELYYTSLNYTAHYIWLHSNRLPALHFIQLHRNEQNSIRVGSTQLHCRVTFQ